jgi:hypothetical protein
MAHDIETTVRIGPSVVRRAPDRGDSFSGLFRDVRMVAVRLDGR